MSDDRRQQSPEAAAVFRLVAEGKLPPASGISATNDAPLWDLGGLASILGLAVDDLLDHLRAAPPRFEVTAPKGGAGAYRMLAK